MKIILAFIVVQYSFFISNMYPQEIETISVNFTRIIETEGNKELIKGNIYYQTPKKIVLSVIDPVLQWMVLDGNVLLIYYPNERKAFQIKNENPFSLPFFEVFLGINKDDFGLSEIGYSLSHNETKSDTLFTYWKPPEQAKNTLGDISVGLVENKLVLIEIENAKKKKLAKSTYYNHVRYNNSFFPMEIVTVRNLKKSSIYEKVVYNNLQINVPLPNEVLTFKIPADVEIKESQW